MFQVTIKESTLPRVFDLGISHKTLMQTPLFIVGYPRSGTTLLTALLDVHPQIRLAQEPEIIRAMRSYGMTSDSRLSRNDRSELLEKMRTVGACRNHLATLPPDLLSRFVEHPEELSFKEVYELLLQKDDGIPVWGEKSIGNTLYISDLKTLYPNAVIVHIVRDPRAAILSHFRKNIVRSGDAQPSLKSQDVVFFAKSAIKWAVWVTIAKQQGRSLCEETYIELRYEELVSDPEAALRRICEAVALDFEPVMLSTAQRAKDPALAIWSKNVVKPIDNSRARAGAELPAWANYLVERFSGRTMREFGYPATESQVRLLDRLVVEAQVRFKGRNLKSAVLNDITRRVASDKISQVRQTV